MTYKPLLRLLVVAILLPVSPSALAFGAIFMAQGPMGHLKKSDVELARVAIRTVLESSVDNEMATWSNPATNASGTVMATKTFVSKGLRCRAASFTIHAGGQDGSSKWNLCKTKDGWKVVE